MKSSNVEKIVGKSINFVCKNYAYHSQIIGKCLLSALQMKEKKITSIVTEGVVQSQLMNLHTKEFTFSSVAATSI